MRRGILLAGLLVAVSCGGGPEAPPPQQRHLEPVQLRPPELPQVQPPRPRTLEELERDLGLQPGTLEREMERGYQAGPGDVLAVTFPSHPKLSQEATVAPDGSLALTSIGGISVRGLGTDEIREAVAEAAEKAGVKQPAVSVSVRSVAKRFVTFIAPGFKGSQVEIAGQGTLLETVVASGWKAEPGAAGGVALIRGGRTTIIELEQITMLRDVRVNIRLHANDILIAVNQEPFEVKGAVASPGRYAVPASGHIGLQDAIAMAGGLKFPVEMGSVRVLRRDGRARYVDLNRYLFNPGSVEPVGICAGDTVFVPPAHETGVFVFGMVAKPGLHRVTAPVTVSRVIAQAVPERFGAVLDGCKVVRGYPAKPEVIGVNVEDLLEGDTSQDLVMRDGDVLYVPETALSDVLDVLGRILGPVSGAVQPTVQVYTATQMRR